jgi:hypothetical protein
MLPVCLLTLNDVEGRFSNESVNLLDCLNHYAAAIQALAAIAIVFLTIGLLWVNHKYVVVGEAMQKPHVTLRISTREDAQAIIHAPHVMQVAQLPHVRLLNVGTGPALHLTYSFQQVRAEAGANPFQISGIVAYMPAGFEWDTPIGRGSLANRTVEFQVSYQSLSGKKYETRFTIEDGIITP